MKNNYITVLDFEIGRVFQYDLDKFGDDYMFVDEDMPTNDELEELLIDLGHNLGNIEWMSHEDPQLITTQVR
tara:strand:+ start:316 stop:531 length:216 start_codon:yes stop_codon:yes gene_type:complete